MKNYFVLLLLCCLNTTVYSQNAKKYNFISEIGHEFKINCPNSEYVTDILFNLNFEFKINPNSLYGIYYCFNMPATKGIRNKLFFDYLNTPEKLIDLTRYDNFYIQIGPVYTKYWSDNKYACYSNVSVGPVFLTRNDYYLETPLNASTIQRNKFARGYYGHISGGIGRYFNFKNYPYPEFFGLSVGLNHLNVRNISAKYSNYNFINQTHTEYSFKEDVKYFGLVVSLTLIVNFDSF